MNKITTLLNDKNWRVMAKRAMALLLVFVMILGNVPVVYATGDIDSTDPTVITETTEPENTEPEPTPEPTTEPTTEPTPEPTTEPTPEPTTEPTPEPTTEPTPEPTPEPTTEPETIEPETTVPETTEPETTEPETTEPSIPSCTCGMDDADIDEHDLDCELVIYLLGQVQPEDTQETGSQIFNYGETEGYLPADSTSTSETYQSVSGNGILVIEFSDTFTSLDVTGNMTVGGLRITGSGTLTVGGDVTITGDLECGNATVQIAGNATVDGDAAISHSNWTLTAPDEANNIPGSSVFVGGNISLTEANLSNAAYFGISGSATGTKTLTEDNVTFSNVALVGVKPENTGVLMTVAPNYPNLTNSRLVCDYLLTYHEDETVITPQEGWPTSYRVIISDGSTPKFLVSGKEVDSFALPAQDQVIGYTFQGWKKTADGDTITALTAADVGSHDLYISWDPNPVTVTWELGYEPGEYTNDAADPVLTWEPGTPLAGTELIVPTPFQFGYDFKGWQVMKEGVAYGEAFTGSMTIESAYLTPGEDAGSAMLALKALWTPHEFPLKLQIANLPSGYTINDVQLKTEGDADWLHLADFTTAHGGNLGGNNDMQYADAQYDTTVGAYIESILPGLQIRTSDGEWTVAEWSLAGVVYHDESKIAMGQGNIFGVTVPEGYTLRSYQDGLREVLLKTMTCEWHKGTGQITFDPQNEWSAIWTVFMNGEPIQLVNNQAEYMAGDDIVWKRKSEDLSANAGFGFWVVSNDGQRVYPREYVEGEYLCYEYILSTGDVVATFQSNASETTIDLAASPILDAVVTVNGIERKGFWYGELLDCMTPLYAVGSDDGYGNSGNTLAAGIGSANSNTTIDLNYFYEYPQVRDRYITTSTPTTNQFVYLNTNNGTYGKNRRIYLVGAIDMVARTTYQGMKDKMDPADHRDRESVSGFSNLLIDQNYCVDTVTIYMNENVTRDYTIAAIGIAKGVTKQNNKSSKINFDGRAKNKTSFYIGTIFDTESEWYYHNGIGLTFSKMTLREYELSTAYANYPADYPYLNTQNIFHDSSAHNNIVTINTNNADMELPLSDILGGYFAAENNTYSHLRNLGSGDFLTASGSYKYKIDCRYIANTTNSVRVLEGSLYGYIYTNSGTTKTGNVILIKGNLYNDTNNGAYFTNGALIVLGESCLMRNMTLDLGITAIASSVEIISSANSLDLGDNRIIANVIRNPIYKTAISTAPANSNGDSYPWGETYTQSTSNRVSNLNFNAGEVYLLGYYGNNGSNAVVEPIWDSVNNCWNENNPLHELAEMVCSDMNGSPKVDVDVLNSEAFQQKLDSLYETAKTENADSMCMTLGNSEHGDLGLQINFNGANIYAAGHMQLAKNTYVSGGVIEASSVSSKRNLTITGGTIKAKEIGTGRNLTWSTSDGTSQYFTTTVSGGTLITDRLGPLSGSTFDNLAYRGALEISGGTIQAYTTGSTTRLVHDSYLNYVYDSSIYAVEEGLPEVIRVTAPDVDTPQWQTVDVDLKPIPAGTIAAPHYVDASEEGVLNWSRSATEALYVSGYDTAGNMTFGDTLNGEFADYAKVVLQVLRRESKNLTIYQDIEGVVSSVEVDSASIDEPAEKDWIPYLVRNKGQQHTYQVTTGSQVQISLNKSMKDLVVFWYKDANGRYVNLNPVVSEDGMTVSFAMPFTDCELYITREMPLYLDRFEFTLSNEGFQTEVNSDQMDTCFAYQGSYCVLDSRVDGLTVNGDSFTLKWKELYGSNLSNRFSVASGFEQKPSQTITLGGLQLQYWAAQQPINIGDHVTLRLDVSQASHIGKVIAGENVDLTLNGVGEEKALIFLNHITTVAETNCTFRNLNIQASGGLIAESSSISDTLNLLDCKVVSTSIFRIGRNFRCLVYENCDMNLKTDSSNTATLAHWNGNLLKEKAELVIKGSDISVANQGTLFSAVEADILMENSSISHTYYSSDVSDIYIDYISSVTLKDSVWNSEFDVPVTNLTLNGASQINVDRNAEAEGYDGKLFSKTLVMNNGIINAAYIVCAGYNTNQDGALDPMGYKNNAGKLNFTYSGISDPGIQIYGGVINALFVGGDYNGKVSICGGTVNAKYIGTMGSYVFRRMDTKGPFAGADVYSWTDETAPMIHSSTVTISGGTVNVADGGHLGGHDSTVSISNGTVNLTGTSQIESDGQPIIITNAEILGENGDIVSKSSNITISGGDTKIHVNSITATSGTVAITDANGEHFENPYPSIYNDRKSDEVAVWVENELRAHELLVTNGSIVYAANAYSYALPGDTGTFTVVPNSGAELYTTTYGYLGGGEHTKEFIPNNEGGNQNIWGGTAIAIHYDLGNMFGESAAGVDISVNPESYEYTPGQMITLNPLFHPYLDFVGWMDTNGNTASTVNTGMIPRENVVTRVAVWSPKPIKFKVIMSGTLFGEGEDIANEVDTDPTIGTLVEDTYTWTEILDGAYLGQLWGNQIEEKNIFKFSEHPLHTHTITAVAVYTPDGTTKLDGNFVTQDMIDAYASGKNGPLLIQVGAVSKTALNMVFDLNIKNNKPGTAQFAATSLAGKTQVEVYAKMGVIFNTVANANFVDELTDLTAVGYDFLGWSTAPDITPEEFLAQQETYGTEFVPDGKVGTDIIAKNWYAVWKPKDYHVRFYASSRHPDGGTYHINEDGLTDLPTGVGFTATTDSLEGMPYKDIVLTYDEPIDWTDHIVPTVWREGQVFKTWYYVDSVNNTERAIEVSESELFSLASGHFDAADFNNDGNLEEGDPPVITFYALYEPLEVHYERSGGQWAAEMENNEAYANAGTPLRALIDSELPDGGEYVSGDDNSTYRAISTTGTYFNANNNYVADDYRETIGKKGYTFAGWYTDPACTEPIEDTPKFSLTDITVYAKWIANDYSLTLHADDTAYTSGAAFTLKTGSSYEDNSGKTEANVKVTVGQLITASNWPARDLWGTRQAGETTDPRPLWGFMFAPLDPWYPAATDDAHSAEYVKYNNDIKALYKAGQLLVKNTSRFTLPEDAVVPDYPNGAVIDMYAAYNDFAIVFVQYYRSKTGEVTQRIIETVKYGAISENTLKDVQELEMDIENSEVDTGYTALGWYVNTTTINASKEFKVDDFIDQDGTKFTAYKDEAMKPVSEGGTGTYDIIVYHIYAADEKKTGMEFVSDPLAQLDPTEIAESRVQEIEIPMNMQPGTLCYSFKDASYSTTYAENGFTAAPYSGSLGFAENLEHYDFADALTKAGLKLQIIRDGVTYEVDLSSTNTGSTATDIEVQPGDRLVLTLDHSYVITQEQEYVFDLAFTFQDGSGKLITGQQLLLDDVKVTLKPAQYDVVYHANAAGMTLKDAGSYGLGLEKTVEFSGNANVVFRGITQMPTFQGYTNVAPENEQAWYDDAGRLLVSVSDTEIRIDDTVIDYDDQGKLHLYAKWQANEHTLSVESKVYDGWTVEYHDGTQWKTVGNGQTLPYGTEIRFKAKDESQMAEFIKLDIAGQEPLRLDIDIEKAAEEDYYYWSMPDADVNVSYSDVMDLFLDNGDIVLTPNGFYQDKAGQQNTWHSWPGGYRIRQNAQDDITNANSNTLTINGNMNGRTIYLDRLNTSATNSISLEQHGETTTSDDFAPAIGQNVVLTLTKDQVKAANILVPQSANLTVSGTGAENGLILTPTGGDSAAGRSSGAYNSSITISNCSVTVNEMGEYTGIWFGGRDTQDVTLTNVTLNQTVPDNGIGGRYVTYANTVELTNCSIGTDAQRITEPIYAEQTLSIHGGTLLMQPIVPQGTVSMIGTATAGTVAIDDAAQIDIKYSGTYRSDRPFTGTMKLGDQDSHVVIDTMLVLDAQYGSISIDETGVTQGNGILGIGNKTTAHTGNYLILQEFDDLAVNVAVDAEKTITFQQPYGEAEKMNIGELSVSADTTLRTLTSAAGDSCTLNVDKVTIDDAALNVDLAAGDSVNLANDFGNSTGSYNQKDGSLSRTDGSIEGRRLDVVLEDVTVLATNLIAQNLTLEDCSVTCTDGEVGSYGAADGSSTATWVTLSGTVNIDAAKLGALGEQNKTYTGVILDGANVTFEGDLVQDHYRIAYERLDTAIYTAPDYTVFRATQTGMGGEQMAAAGNVPSNPARKDGAEDTTFKVWYYLNGENLIALTEADTIPAGYADKDTLAADLIDFASQPAEDKTRTLTLYAGMEVTGTASIRKGRNFTFVEGDNAVSIPANSAWTLSLSVKDALIGGHYELAFGTALPAGTKLTLVTFDANGTPTYYYAILQTAATAVNLSDFVAMSDHSTHPVLPGNGTEDQIVVAADFFAAEAAPTGGTITLNYVYPAQEGQTAGTVPLASVTVTVNSVNGAISVSGNEVTVTAPTSSVYAGRTLGVVAEFTDGYKLPYDATAKLGDIPGTPLDGNKFFFEVGEDSGSYAYSFEGIYGNHRIRWSLVATESGMNALSNVIGTTDEITYSGGDKPAQPSLSASIRTVDGSTTTSRVLAAGTEQSHSIVLNYTVQNTTAVTVTVEKQNQYLAHFVAADNSGTASDGTATATIPSEKGVYRICLSIDESSVNDNVYFVFVVE